MRKVTLSMIDLQTGEFCFKRQVMFSGVASDFTRWNEISKRLYGAIQSKERVSLVVDCYPVVLEPELPF